MKRTLENGVWEEVSVTGTQVRVARQMRLARNAWAKLRARTSEPFDPAEEEPEDPETYRAMDLTLRVGELLLASGEGTETVTEVMRSLAVAYGLPRAESAVTFTAITLSCQPGKGAAPITGERLVRRRSPDYSRLVDTHKLVEAAALGTVDLDEAFDRLRSIKHGPSRYPRWLVALALPTYCATGSCRTGWSPPAPTSTARPGASGPPTGYGCRSAAWT